MKSTTWLMLALLVSMIAGCMGSPQNNQEVNAGGPIAFGGSVPESTAGQMPSTDIEITGVPSAQGQSLQLMQAMVPFATFPVNTSSPTKDGNDQNWYGWAGKAVIPYNYWSDVPGRNQLEVQIRAGIKNAGIYLNTFDFNAPSNPECDAAKQSKKMNDMIAACKSPQSPVVKLVSDCGNYKEACCHHTPSCVAHYECAVFNYVPNPAGEGEDYFGSPSQAVAYSGGPITTPPGRESMARCMARMQDTFF